MKKKNKLKIKAIKYAFNLKCQEKNAGLILHEDSTITCSKKMEPNLCRCREAWECPDDVVKEEKI